MDEEALSKARANVIEKFIVIDNLINAIISQHYFKKVSIGFVLDVLYDEYFSFGLKRSILEKIVPDIDQGKRNKIGRLNTIRNLFAHCGPKLYDSLEEPSHVLIRRIPDPKKPKESLDFDALYSEFIEIDPEINEYLSKIYIDLGGQVVGGAILFEA